MKIRDLTIELATATKLHNFIFVSGTASIYGKSIESVSLTSPRYSIVDIKSLSTPYSLGSSELHQVDFVVQALLDSPFDLGDDLSLSFLLDSGETISSSLFALTTEKRRQFPNVKVYADFCDQIRNHPNAKVLDLGGRDRSRLDRSQEFPGVDFTVLDIVPSENVDVVGDAHELTQYFPKNHFDYMISLSVFEHLAMPWKVAIEMNKVLKVGGLAFIQAPQSIGMHDLPWDFWRFSDSAWNALFNTQTGFEIVAQFRDVPNFILPFFVRQDQLDAEKAAGFEISIVIAKKVSKCKEEWHTKLSEVATGNYPA